MTTYLTADTHFGHENVIKFCNRPYANAAEMDQALIDNWNAVVRPRDTVYHLGDFAYRCDHDRMKRIFNRLNGEKHLFTGNHDTTVTEKLGWKSVDKLNIVSIDGVRACLCHYPIRNWPGRFRGVMHFFGHSHGGSPDLERSCDVGVDVWGYFPVAFDDLRLKLEAIPLPGQDDEDNSPPTP